MNLPPAKRLQFVFHDGLLYVEKEGKSFTLRLMDTHDTIARSGNLYDLRVIGDDYLRKV